MLGIRVLGPMEIIRSGPPVRIGTPKQRAVLAMLTIRPGQVVSVGELIDELWPEVPPRSAMANTRSYAANLRRALDACVSTRGLLVVRRGGYELNVEPDVVDAIRYTEAIRHAERLLAVNRLDEARRALTEADERWRGVPFSGAAVGPTLTARRSALEGERLTMIELTAEVDLRAGRPRAAASLLRQHSQLHPDREAMSALMIRALYEQGDIGAAVVAYRSIRDAMVDRLGVEPGDDLERLYRAILNREALPDPPRRAGPASGPATSGGVIDVLTAFGAPAASEAGATGGGVNWLPRPASNFIGRDAALARVRRRIERSPSIGPLVQLIDGMAGSGKTALAVVVAHQVSDRYPDGQLFVDLRGHGHGVPLTPGAALVDLLRQLGVSPGRIPGDLQERVALWCSELGSRRAIVVLDNAADAEQVRPLLPSAPGCAVLVTSRKRLVALDSEPPESLTVLSPRSALELLARIVGDQRIQREAEAAGEVVRACGYLPLAIRLAGARLAHRPQWRVADLRDRLHTKAAALGEFAAGEDSVASAFAASYEPLPDDIKRAFRLLGLFPGERFGLLPAAALLGLPPDEAERALGLLVDHHLVEEPSAGVYRLHDLLRQYSAGLVGADSEPVRTVAITEVLDFFLQSAVLAVQALEPVPLQRTIGIPTPRRPDLRARLGEVDESWLEHERHNLTALVRRAFEAGLDETCWRLVRVAWRYQYVRGYFDDIFETHRHGLAAAERLGDEAATAEIHNYVAAAHLRTGHYQDAHRHLDAAISLRDRIGDSVNASRSRANLAVVHWMRGRLQEAIELNRQALAEWRRSSDESPPRGLMNHGMFVMQSGDYPESLRLHRNHLQDSCHRRDLFNVAQALGHLGAVRVRLKQYSHAVRLIKASLALRGRTGHRYAASEAMNDLGIAYRHLGQLAAARAQHEAALQSALDTGEQHAQAAALNDLGLTLAVAGNAEQAFHSHRRALASATRIDHPYEQGRALAALAEHLVATDPDDARRHWERAFAIFHRIGVPEQAEVEQRLAEVFGAGVHRPVPARPGVRTTGR